MQLIKCAQTKNNRLRAGLTSCEARGRFSARGPNPPRYENLWIQRHTKLLNNFFQFYPQITAISQPSYLHQDFWIIFRFVKTGFKHQWNLYILLIWVLEQPELIGINYKRDNRWVNKYKQDHITAQHNWRLHAYGYCIFSWGQLPSLGALNARGP
jgi:hypothetical protein